MDLQALTKLQEFLEKNKQQESVEIEAFAKYTFHTLPQQELLILILDVQDEIKRREDDVMPFLPILLHLPANRNQARQKLATLSLEQFYELVACLTKCMEQKYSTERHKLNVELKKLEQKATARSMDRNRSKSQQPPMLHLDVKKGSGASSAPLHDVYPVFHHPPMPELPKSEEFIDKFYGSSPKEQTSTTESVSSTREVVSKSQEVREVLTPPTTPPPKDKALENYKFKHKIAEQKYEALLVDYKRLQSDAGDMEKRLKDVSKNCKLLQEGNDDLRSMIETKAKDIKKLQDSLKNEIAKRHALELALQEVYSEQSSETPEQVEEWKKELDRLRGNETLIVQLKGQIEVLQSQVENYKKAKTLERKKKELKTISLTQLRGDCQENGKKLSDAIQAKDKKAVISFTKSFLLTCKKVSDESERLDTLGLLNTKERDLIAKIDQRLADHLSLMMESAKHFATSLDTETFLSSTTDTLDTIHKLCDVLEQVFEPAKAVEERLRRLSTRNVSSSVEVEFEKLERQPYSLQELQNFQRKQLRDISSHAQSILSKPQVDELEFQMWTESIDLFVYETRNTIGTLSLTDSDSKRVDFMVGLLSDLTDDVVHDPPESIPAGTKIMKELIRVFCIH
jgi:DNA repair exonuclease SbcCD ATPase subunit